MRPGILCSVSVADVRIDELVTRAADAVASRWPGASIDAPRRLQGGVSSVTVAAELRLVAEPAREVVIKAAPTGLPAVGNRDVLRQSRLMALLRSGSDLPVPAVLVEVASDPPFFVMEFVSGESYEPKIDLVADPPSGDLVHRRARVCAHLLASIHRLNIATLGLATETAVSVEEELLRWARLFETVDPAIAPGHGRLLDRLLATMPEPANPVLVHGDFRLGNTLFDDDTPLAIIDWELWAVGDARADLAMFATMIDPVYRFHRIRDERNEEAGRGMPELAELLSWYESGVDIDLSALDWFIAQIQYKSAAITASFVKRNRRLEEPNPVFVLAEERIQLMLDRGNEVMDAVDAGAAWRR